MMAVVSIACTYLIIEFIFFRALLPYVSLNIKTHLPDTAGVLVQNSKIGFLPHDYVALLGDSYAEGLGDWLLQAQGDRTKPFHSANVIHDATGRDVVSFGRGGAGSAEAIVGRPALVFGGTSCYLFPAIDAPRDMFIYFYEGNDIEDNNDLLSRVTKKYGNMSDASIDRYLIEQLVNIPWAWKCRTYLLDTMARMARFLFQHHIQGLSLDTAPQLQNRVIVAANPVAVPSIQGTGLRYGDQQVQTGLRVLDRSLAWLKGRFPGVPTTVVYIPAPASIYRFAGPEIVTKLGRGHPIIVTTPATVARRSDMMCRLVHDNSLDHSLGFIDARPALRAAAETRIIHGPIDWDHFNEAGYRVLAGLVLERLQRGPQTDLCSVAGVAGVD